MQGFSSSLRRFVRIQVDSKGKKLWRVFASARKLESLLKLKEDGIETVQLDVTKQESVDAAIAAVLKAAHTIDLVICNAGKASLNHPTCMQVTKHISCSRPCVSCLYIRFSQNHEILISKTGWLLKRNCKILCDI